MQRPSLTITIPDLPSPSSSARRELRARRLRQQRSAARASYLRSIQQGGGAARPSSSRRRQEPAGGVLRSFFSRWRLSAALRSFFSRSRSRELLEPRRESSDGEEWDELRDGFPFTVPASTEDLMDLHVPAAGDTREMDCAVCLEDFKADDELRRMPCSHSFHEICIFRWLRINRDCPCCRLPLSSVDDLLDGGVGMQQLLWN